VVRENLSARTVVTLLRLVVRNSMGRAQSGNRSMVTTDVHCLTAMYRVKQFLGASLTLRNYNAQVGETYAMIKALNKLTGIGMPETQYIV
jgi:hypothetical protein